MDNLATLFGPIKETSPLNFSPYSIGRYSYEIVITLDIDSLMFGKLLMCLLHYHHYFDKPFGRFTAEFGKTDGSFASHLALGRHFLLLSPYLSFVLFWLGFAHVLTWASQCPSFLEKGLLGKQVVCSSKTFVISC